MKKHLIRSLAILLVCIFMMSGFNFSILASNETDIGDRLSAINIAISDKAYLMLYFSDLGEAERFTVTVPAKDGTSDVTEVAASSLSRDSSGRYMLKVAIPFAQLNDRVKIQGVRADGTKGKVRQYSVRDYADKLFALTVENPDNAAYLNAAEVVKFMLNHGAMAQKHSDHNASDLANEGLYYRGTNPVDNMSYEDMYEIAAPSATATDESALKFTHVTASFDDKVSLRFYFEYNGSSDDLAFTVNSVESKAQKDENGAYYVLVSNIYAINFGKQYQVKASDVECSATIRYSVLNYLQDALASTGDENLQGLAYSAFQFYTSVLAYAGRTVPGADSLSATCTHDRTYIDRLRGNLFLCSDCGSDAKGFAGEITLGDNSTITTNEGLTYTAAGFNSAGGEGGLLVSAGNKLVISGEDIKSDAKSNRFHLHYYSSAPVKLTMTYTYGSKASPYIADEVYYMEAGENYFSAVEYSFLASKGGGARADKIAFYGQCNHFSLISITVEPLESRDLDFALFNYYTEVVDPKLIEVNYNGKTCQLSYVENDHYKLGVNLTWGGAVSELYDTSLTSAVDAISSGTNLVNTSDTGRLIQQSYYGTNGSTDSRYTPHYWSSRLDLPYSKWSYNPVQGGDANNNQSRIIDFEVGEDYIYVKAQPLDWANHEKVTKNGVTEYVKAESRYTFCYIENRYNLKDDCIRVDNRLVDFSGYKHPNATQELPAVYVLAYLDDFYWYNGTDPWNFNNGLDGLTRVDDLPFWGDPTKYEETTLNFQVSNKETWGAFVNQSTLYGIGVYAPNTDVITAGRLDGSEENMSADAKSGYTGYFGPAKNFKIVSYEPIEYSYLICAGKLDKIRETFRENKDFASNYSLNKNSNFLKIPDEVDMENIDFTKEINTLLVRNPNNTKVSFDKTVGATKLDVTGADPFFHINYRIYDGKVCYADDYDFVDIEYMIPADVSGRTYQAQLFYCVGNVFNPSGNYAYFPINLIADGEFHTARIATSSLGVSWSGMINQLRIDFLHEAIAGDVFYLRSVKLVKSDSIHQLGTSFGPDALAAEINDGYGEPDISSISVSADGSDYVRITKANVNGAYFTIRTNTESTNSETGQHLVIKYRTTSASLKQFNVFAGTEKNAASEGDTPIQAHLTSDGEWHITYVDLSQSPSVTAASDGKYYLNYVRLDMTEPLGIGEHIDIAYVAICNADDLKKITANNSLGYIESNHSYHLQIDALTNGTKHFVKDEFVGSSAILSVPTATTNGKWELTLDGWLALDNPNTLAGLYYNVINEKGNYSGWKDISGALSDADSDLIGHVGSASEFSSYTDPTLKRINCTFDLGEFGGTVTVILAAAFRDPLVDGEVSVQTLLEFEVDLPTFTHQSIMPNATSTGHIIGADNFTAEVNDEYLTLTNKKSASGDTFMSLQINTPSDASKLKTGKYLEIKYRIRTSGEPYTYLYHIYASTSVYAASSGDHALYNNPITADNEWHIAYYDLSRVKDVVATDGEYYVNFVRFDFFALLRAGDHLDIAYIDLTDTAETEEIKINWHASVDVFASGTSGSDDTLYKNCSANSTIGNRLADGTGTIYRKIAADHVQFMHGWIAVDGYDVSEFTCNVYSEGGTLLKTVSCVLFAAEQDVTAHVSNNMRYGEGTVPYRLNGNSDIIDLEDYAGQIVTVVYAVGLVGSDDTVEMLRIDVVVPAN